MHPRRRRFLLLTLILVGAPVLAGCASETTRDDADPPAEMPPEGGTPDGHDDDTSEESEVTGSDEELSNAMSRAEPSEPAPKGITLDRADIDRLLAAFDDQPYTGGQDTPGHVFKFVSPETFIFLHFAEAEPEDFANLLYVGTGVKGVACAETQPDADEGAFTHFHKYSSPTWEGGHGGPAGAEGYWFTHIAVDTFEMPWGTVTPGVDYDFMPTPAAACGGNLPSATFEPPGADDLTSEEIAELIAAFPDEPFEGGQETPSHQFLWVNEEVFIFLHFDTPDPLEATKLLYYGPGMRGEACAGSQPHGDTTHFHKWTSASWEGGHGGAAGAYGYWFLHSAADSFTMPWGDVRPGPDRSFMPTPVEDCGEGFASSSGSASDGDLVEVRLVASDAQGQPFAFTPENLEITAGTTVRWTNDEDVFHTVTSTDTQAQRTPNGKFDSALASHGDTFAFTFDEPGTYHYYCKPHSPFMFGTITVTA